MALRRIGNGAPGDPGSTQPSDNGPWGKDYPTLCEFLTSSVWDDGAARVPGTLLVFAEGPLWKCCLKDRDGGHVVFVSAKTPIALLKALEAGLVGDGLDWRADRKQGGKR